MRIDLARPADVDACARLAADLLAHDPVQRRAKLRRDLVEPENTDPDRALFVAHADGLVVGYSRVERWTGSADAPQDNVPQGWYLMGLLVHPAHRRAGIGRALTEARLDWLRPRTDRVWYFANARHAASLALHAGVGFEEVRRDLTFPGIHFEGGVGVLGVIDLGATPGRASGTGGATCVSA